MFSFLILSALLDHLNLCNLHSTSASCIFLKIHEKKNEYRLHLNMAQTASNLPNGTNFIHSSPTPFAPIVALTRDQPHKVQLLMAMCGMILPSGTHPRCMLHSSSCGSCQEKCGERRDLPAADCLMVSHMILEKCLGGSGLDNRCVWCIKT